MSWDLFVMDLPPGARTVADIPSDYEPRALMSRRAVVEGIRRAVPDADFSDPTWGRISGRDYSIEINLPSNDPVESFGFHVRGGDAAVEVISAILQHLGLRAIDVGEGSVFDPATAVESLRRWRAYRDRVVDS